MAPVEQSSMVRAITAADDCTQKVSTPPRSRKMMVVEKASGSNDIKKFVTSGLLPMSIDVPVAFSVVRPSSSRPKPNRKSPT